MQKNIILPSVILLLVFFAYGTLFLTENVEYEPVSIRYAKSLAPITEKDMKSLVEDSSSGYVELVRNQNMMPEKVIFNTCITENRGGSLYNFWITDSKKICFLSHNGCWLLITKYNRFDTIIQMIQDIPNHNLRSIPIPQYRGKTRLVDTHQIPTHRRDFLFIDIYPHGVYALPMHTDIKKKLTRRLKIIEGQVRGLQELVEKDTYCIHVITQTSAVKQALSGIEDIIMENHLRTCAVDQIRTGKANKTTDEILKVYRLKRK